MEEIKIIVTEKKADGTTSTTIMTMSSTNEVTFEKENEEE